MPQKSPALSLTLSHPPAARSCLGAFAQEFRMSVWCEKRCVTGGSRFEEEEFHAAGVRAGNGSVHRWI